MEAKNKAKELVHRFQKTLFFHVTDDRIDIEEAKQCALIVVEEIIKILEDDENIYVLGDSSYIYFWQRVKQEIEKL